MLTRYTASIVVFALLPAPLVAQRTWLAPDPGRSAGLEVAKGFFRRGSNVDFASFVVTANVRFPVSDKVAITAELPFSRFSEPESNPTSTALGNPWIGMEVVTAPNIVVEAGIRPGIGSRVFSHEFAQLGGVLADFDRFEAWIPKTTSLRAMIHVGDRTKQGTVLTGRVGGSAFLPSGGRSSAVYANYGLRLGVRRSSTLTSLSLTGRVGISYGGTLVGSLRTNVTQLALNVEAVTGSFRPRLSIGTYINESAREMVKAIVSVGATFVR